MEKLKFVFVLLTGTLYSHVSGSGDVPEHLGKYLRPEISETFAHGIRCALGNPKGEDGIEYCPNFTKEQLSNMNQTAKDLLLLTTPSRSQDVTLRFQRSASIFNYTVKELGSGERLSDKVVLHHLKKYIEELVNETPLKLVVFLDGADTLLSSGPLRMVEEFQASGAAVLISGDPLCWPDKTLQSKYPKVESGRRFLNAGAFIGAVEDIHDVLKESTEDTESLQELLTQLYIKESTRKKFHLQIDSRSALFQNINGATNDIEVDFVGKESYLRNTVHSTVPVVLRATQGTTRALNTIASYLAKSWNPEDGCRSCWENMASLEEKAAEDFPSVTLGVFVEKATPFLEEFFLKLNDLIYPKKKIHLFLHNVATYHNDMVDAWYEAVKDDYNTTKYITSSDSMKEWHAKDQALELSKSTKSDFLFVLDSEAHLDNPYVLKLLIEQNRTVVAPMLTRPYKAWSNFWGDLTVEGYYARSIDYMEIVQNERRGLWNVPYINSCFLLRKDVIDKHEVSFINKLLDPDMAFCSNLRDQGVFMYVSNRMDFGHLVNADNYNIEPVNPDLYQLFDNRWDWEARYIHENFTHYISEGVPVETPCPDVYWFPLFKVRYTEELVELMESYGSWSDGSHSDTRLEGGYESVPTIDIHMKQVNYEEAWLDILKVYVQPMQQKVFDGYFNDVGPPRAIMNFMVRYKPDEQPELRPHHDTSTYTINVAMNKAGIDFQGGGCRFIRYDCKVTDTRQGWLLMHPGRLTHLHEGLRVTNGTRYIVVSFVDP